jgi:formylglycine-generating enzyme required for sulfatase activity
MSTLGKGLHLLLISSPFISTQLMAQTPTMGKNWSFISGTQKAVNESKRVYYQVGPGHSLGSRVNNFEEMKNLYPDDSLFVKVHLNASEVFDSVKLLSGPAFFINKTEVSNAQYWEFLKDCIHKWMKENRTEIMKKYGSNSPEYIKTVYNWLLYEPVNRFRGDSIKEYTWAELLKQDRNLKWSKITYDSQIIFPITEVWTTDFPLSYNDVMSRHYLTHPKYTYYPVVGISQLQASLYCKWLTAKANDGFTYRLPTELEWERAASIKAEKPPKKSSGSPTKNHFLRNSKGNYIANYRPAVDNFSSDGGVYPLPVDSYFPNDAGCHNMIGNVAEWTNTAMLFKDGNSIREGFIIKGGAWPLPEAACSVGSRTILPPEALTSYIGFRMVATPNVQH